MSGNPELPRWPGAAGAYARAYRILASMARSGHVTRTRGRCSSSPELREFIEALDRGDEEQIKGLNWQHRVHDKAEGSA
jgi:hypothetical protein